MEIYPALPIAGVLACFSLFGAHALRMRTEKNYREMWGAAGIGLLPAAIFWLFVVSAEPDMLKRTMWLIPVGALVGACLFAYAGYVVSDIRSAKGAQPSPKQEGSLVAQGPTINTWNQSGGQNTINMGPRYAEIGQQTIDGIKSKIPAGSHVEVLRGMQDPASSEMAQKISMLVKELGYDVHPYVGDALGLGSFKGMRILGENRNYQIVVGDTRAD
jgi:hypothetical protein